MLGLLYEQHADEMALSDYYAERYAHDADPDWDGTAGLSDMTDEDWLAYDRHAASIWPELADFDPDRLAGGPDFDSEPPF